MDILIGFNTSSKIYGHLSLCRDGFQYAIVNDMLRFGSIKVDHMQALESQTLKFFGNLSRRVVIDGLLIVVAFRQSDALSIDDVYGR